MIYRMIGMIFVSQRKCLLIRLGFKQWRAMKKVIQAFILLFIPQATRRNRGRAPGVHLVRRAAGFFWCKPRPAALQLLPVQSSCSQLQRLGREPVGFSSDLPGETRKYGSSHCHTYRWVNHSRSTTSVAVTCHVISKTLTLFAVWQGRIRPVWDGVNQLGPTVSSPSTDWFTGSTDRIQH